jgi:hypothetical protein
MWMYQGKLLTDVPDGFVGFVYVIENLKTGKKYFGKKNFYSTRRIKVKNRTNRKCVTSQSDWRNYSGSNDLLLSEIQAGKESDFKKEILYLCRSKGEMALLEAKEQIVNDVLYHPDKFYNQFIGCKVHSKHLKITSKKPT